MNALGHEAEVGEILAERKLTLALAESCTGGLLAHRITMAPGSSRYFLGGVVSYSNGAKSTALGVPEALLAQHGAVSEPVAAAMAAGARRLFGADVALATTGIAGPGGGSARKPVGTVFVALNTAGVALVHSYHFFGDRLNIQEQSCRAALNMLREWVNTVLTPKEEDHG